MSATYNLNDSQPTNFSGQPKRTLQKACRIWSYEACIAVSGIHYLMRTRMNPSSDPAKAIMDIWDLGRFVRACTENLVDRISLEFSGCLLSWSISACLIMKKFRGPPWGGVNNFLMDSNSRWLLCHLSSSKNRTDRTTWLTHSVSGRGPVNQCQSSQPILVHRVRYVYTDKSVHFCLYLLLLMGV